MAHSQATTDGDATAAGAEPPARAATDGQLLTSVLIYDLGTVLRRRLDATLAEAGTGLRTRHFAVLATLGCMEPLSQRAAAEEADIDPATMVKTVDDLERLGLVTRARNPRDRRAHELTLTDQGRDVLRRTELLLEGIEREVFAPLGDEGHARLRAWLLDLLARHGRAGC
jgi:DNA-binding MarR family transcriptional regulator